MEQLLVPNSKSSSIKLIEVTTPQELHQVLHIRKEVFIREQNVPIEIEIDGLDPISTHFLAILDGKAVGTARLREYKNFAKFERIATLKEFRGKGIGKKIVKHMLHFSQSKYPQLTPMMHAQESAISFYIKLGWAPEGQAFIEAGIPHQTLVYSLDITPVTL